jgi:hypothetical protein
VRSKVLPNIAEPWAVVSFSSAHMPCLREARRLQNDRVMAPMVISITSLCGCCQWTIVAVDVMECGSELQCQLGSPAVCGEKWTLDFGVEVDRLSYDQACLIAALKHDT